jgi:hypothetical protein
MKDFKTMQNSDLSIPKSETRKHYYKIWQKYKARETLKGEEKTIVDLMALHKDWYHFWDSTDFDREFDPDTEINPFIHITLDNIITNQINNRKPEQANFTYNKLTARGDSHLEAIHKIAYVFALEFFPVMKEGKTFNDKRYIWKLKNLK